MRRPFLIPLALALIGSQAGCKRPPASPAPSAAYLRHERRQQVDSARQQMELVPPPSKNLYLAVRTLSKWQNPFLTVDDDEVTLHVLQPDEIPTSMGEGTMLRPTSARRQDLTIRVSDLPAALAALPANDWPYGRVIAMEEQQGVSSTQRPAVRRTVEATVQTLNDLGIVIDEWNDNGTAALMR